MHVGPDESFARELREQARPLFAFITMLVGEVVVAEDCFQETCLAAWRHRHRFDRSRDFGAWVRGIARNVVRRSRSVRRPLELDDSQSETLVSPWTSAEEQAVSADRRRALRHCLGELDPVGRDLITLRYNDHLSHREIGRRSGRTVDAVKMQLSRLRRRLEACLRGRLREEDR